MLYFLIRDGAGDADQQGAVQGEEEADEGAAVRAHRGAARALPRQAERLHEEARREGGVLREEGERHREGHGVEDQRLPGAAAKPREREVRQRRGEGPRAAAHARAELQDREEPRAPREALQGAERAHRGANRHCANQSRPERGVRRGIPSAPLDHLAARRRIPGVTMRMPGVGNP